MNSRKQKDQNTKILIILLILTSLLLTVGIIYLFLNTKNNLKDSNISVSNVKESTYSVENDTTPLLTTSPEDNKEEASNQSQSQIDTQISNSESSSNTKVDGENSNGVLSSDSTSSTQTSTSLSSTTIDTTTTTTTAGSDVSGGKFFASFDEAINFAKTQIRDQASPYYKKHYLVNPQKVGEKKGYLVRFN